MKASRWVAPMVVVATFLALAGSALALNEAQAQSRLKTITRSKAACGKGYWKCGNYQQLELKRLSGLTPQWSGTAVIVRGHGSNVQSCVVTAAINSNGTIHSAAVSPCTLLQSN